MVVDKLPEWKNSLNVKYNGPARIITNIPAALGYVNYARVILGEVRNKLSAGNIGCGARTVITATGTRISVLYDGVTNIIKVDMPISGKEPQTLDLFLESAWVRITDIYPLVEEEKPPALVYYSDAVKEWYNHGSSVLDYTNYSAAPWLDRLIFISTGTSARFIIRQYEEGMDSLAIPANAVNKRFAWLYGIVNNGGCCAQTGKAKLFSQCQMGKKRDRIGLIDTFLGETTFLNTKGLYSTNKASYFVLTLSNNTISAKKINFSSRVNWLRNFIKSHAIPKDTLNKFEAYIFTEAKQVSDDSFPVIYDEFDIKGTSFYYGWKGNWKGDRWSIVTNEPIWNDEETYILYHTARRYLIVLSEVYDDTELVQLTAQITLEEEVNWTPRVGIDNIWYPDPLFSAMLPFIPIPDAFHNYPDGYREADAPIYCFYDKNDNLTVIRHSLEYEDANSYYPPYNWPNEGTGLCSPQVIDIDEVSHSGGWKGGFYCALYSTVNISYEGTVTEYDLLSSFTLGTTEVYCQPRLPLVPCVVDDEYYAARNRLYSYDGMDGLDGVNGCWSDMSLRYINRGPIIMYKNVTTGQINNSTPVLVIPFLDCEAVYLGRSLSTNATYNMFSQSGSVFMSIQSIRDSYVFRHAVMWYKQSIWGEGTIVDTHFSGSGVEKRSNIDFSLVTKNNYIEHINQISFIGRTASGIPSGSLPGDVEGATFYLTEGELDAAIESVVGYLSNLFSPTLFGTEDKHYYTYICAVESVVGDMYYTNDLKNYSEGRSSESLPENQNYNGLFIGWN